MNSRRAANRRRSERDSDLHYSAPETHESMRGRMIPHRHPEHHEMGGNYKHEAHASFGSPGSKGASKGPGPLPGAGELHSPGAFPGPAAAKYAQRPADVSPVSPTPPGTAPKGMKVYNQE